MQFPMYFLLLLSKHFFPPQQISVRETKSLILRTKPQRQKNKDPKFHESESLIIPTAFLSTDLGCRISPILGSVLKYVIEGALLNLGFHPSFSRKNIDKLHEAFAKYFHRTLRSLHGKSVH